MRWDAHRWIAAALGAALLSGCGTGDGTTAAEAGRATGPAARSTAAGGTPAAEAGRTTGPAAPSTAGGGTTAAGAGRATGPAAAGATAPGNGRWAGIGKTCARLTAPGFDEARDGFFVARMETDAKSLYAATCVYGGAGPTAKIMVNYMIDKEDGEKPGVTAHSMASQAKAQGQPAAELTGVGEGGVVFVENGAMRAITWSRNAAVMAAFPMDPVSTKQQLAERTGDVTAVLRDLLTALRG